MTLPAVLTLGVGVGATVSVFGLFRGFTRPLPVPHPTEVVSIVLPSALDHDLSGVLLRRDGWRSLRGVTVAEPFVATVLSEGNYAGRVSAARLDPGALELLEVSPELGRPFLPEEAGAAGREVVLLGHELWRGQFKADPGVLGTTIRVNGSPRTVVGVLPERFGFPFNQQLWIPRARGAAVAEDMEIFGRLAPGASRESAREEVRAVLSEWSPDGGRRSLVATVDVRPFTQGRGEMGEGVLLTGIALVLLCLFLVACANVANLLLTRAVERRGALVVHAALGARPTDLVLQAFTEAFLVALAGGALGLLVAWGTTTVTQVRLAENFGYYWIRMQVDWSVVLFGVAATGLAAVVAGAFPAMWVRRADPARALRANRAGTPASGPLSLVVAQIAVSAFALTLAGLLLKGVLGARELLHGLPADRIVVASVSPPEARYPDAGAGERLRRSLLERLGGEPGIRAGASLDLPGLEGRRAEIVDAKDKSGTGQGRGEEDARPLAWNAVTAGYLRLLGADLVEGRLPSATRGPGVEAVIDAELARSLRASRLNPRAELRLAGIADEPLQVRVVGVVAAREPRLSDRVRPGRLYIPLDDLEVGAFRVSLTGPRVEDLAPLLRSTLAKLDPELPATDVRTLAAVRDFRTRAFETGGLLAGTGAAAALVVALVGLFAVLSFRVRKRRAELGVRLALGASPTSIAALVIRDGRRQLLPGLALGLGAAGLLSPKLGIFLLGTAPHDPTVFGGVALGFVVSSLVAMGAPARRAAGLDPARILQED